jgi:D-alanyl-D-alanine carboxypeptidase
MTSLLLFALTHAPAFANGNPDAIAGEFMARKKVPGLAYAVLVNGSIVARGAYGVTDLATRAKVSVNSIFPIASLSKPFVAMGVLSLAEKSRLNLTDPVGRYLPELPLAWQTIPLIRLLDHTSGVPDHINSGAYNFYDPTPIGSDDLLKKLTALPLKFSVGAKYEYSNGNYLLLAKVIERVSGEPYGTFLNERIFAPLGMKNTRTLSMADQASVVPGYRNAGESVRPFGFNPDWCFGNGAIGSTVMDLAKLDAALYTQKLLRQTTLSFVTRPQPLANGKLPNYAMGWAIGKGRGTRMISHSGRVGGWESFFARFADLNATVVLLSNNGDVGLGKVAMDLAGTVLPSLAFAPTPDQFPQLTVSHRELIQSIIEGHVDPTRLNDGMRKDYEAKGQWRSLGNEMKSGGAITFFGPVNRVQLGPNSFRTNYRMDCGEAVWKIELTWDGAGTITGLMVSGL